jgi:hypothetical protein
VELGQLMNVITAPVFWATIDALARLEVVKHYPVLRIKKIWCSVQISRLDIADGKGEALWFRGNSACEFTCQLPCHMIEGGPQVVNYLADDYAGIDEKRTEVGNRLNSQNKP